jgi:hypothetical protein
VKLTGAITDVPFLPEKRIQQDAELLINEYVLEHGGAVAAPVPVEELLEVQLKLDLEIDDLCAQFQSNDVLAVIWFDSKLIKVDKSLDPHESPHLLGRFRFTLAHEVGHWRLHRQYYRADPQQAMLFDGKGRPAFVCRSSDKPPVEWQADTYASYLLMPTKVVVSAWEAWRGNRDAVVLDDLPPAPTAAGRDPANLRLERFCKPMAQQFEVSAEAMRIRLEKLGFLLREKPNTLF